MAECLYELRKNKGMTLEKAKATCQQANYFGTMLVKMGKADALLGGATYSTADTVRPALQIIKTKPGKNIVASCFILVRESATGGNTVLAMRDPAFEGFGFGLAAAQNKRVKSGFVHHRHVGIASFITLI